MQEWRAGKLSATHLVADDGQAKTIDPEDILPDETNDQLIDGLAELDAFDKMLRENEKKLKEAVSALNKVANPSRRQPQVQSTQAILNQLRSGIQVPGGGQP